jgi:hypothetical protein
MLPNNLPGKTSLNIPSSLELPLCNDVRHNNNGKNG